MPPSEWAPGCLALPLPYSLDQPLATPLRRRTLLQEAIPRLRPA